MQIWEKPTLIQGPFSRGNRFREVAAFGFLLCRTLWAQESEVGHPAESPALTTLIQHYVGHPIN